jgi:D-alanine-D-alanine ligase
MKVLILHTLPPDDLAAGRDEGEFDLHAAAQNIARVIPHAQVAPIQGEVREILQLLCEYPPDVVFNACEAPLGRPDLEPHVASLLEWLNIPFTGNRSETLSLCRRKDLTNALLASANIPIPRSPFDAQRSTFDVRCSMFDVERWTSKVQPLPFPCILKPAADDGSASITPDSICHTPQELQSAQSRTPGPSIIQEFLQGREFVVSLWGRLTPDHASIGETLFQNGLQLITYSAKWHIDHPDFANSPLSYTTPIDPALRQEILAICRAAWSIANLRGYARIDVRLDSDNHPRILDINPNPELGPDVGICRAVKEAGWTWETFIQKQLEWAF